MTELVKDRFDHLPGDVKRRGAYRGPARKGRGWAKFGAAVLATAVLAGGGIYAVSVIDQNVLGNFNDLITSPRYIPEKPEYVVPVADPEFDGAVQVTVLNGTEQAGVALTVGNLMRAEGWNIITTASASSNTIEKTIVYYNHLDAEAPARAVAELLSADGIELSTFLQGSRITVVVGTDYLAESEQDS